VLGYVNPSASSGRDSLESMPYKKEKEEKEFQEAIHWSEAIS
jgi:hypothetical protein